METTVRGVILSGCSARELALDKILNSGYRILYVLKDGQQELMICTEEDLSNERIKQDLQSFGIYVLLENIHSQKILIDYKVDETIH